ncbi:pyridoxal 5'-phosphate synthase glutaminase subunit PdxT [Gulosibacter molinativorax]|uniref:Pyridoxal 5'-phosphate synthase subunit PdxT n=1 Tax=Gulosibacter molinativorax TaxID=256821 RepID=A0ABT7C8L0_9MICO|nr:pyridoxal 5'-phosphate synthase glutaminase subunit PdxT [Gulosibacter molinativorax]MDJ1371544.1 pyridoxal 5'-phosphate synthase glutaminase subunit PdxT [Gulosibacter molinativorax]QUY62486.1 Pyridoxal 5'-phosphate synthase subunit PdxT [Gulosibacter molinativorax]
MVIADSQAGIGAPAFSTGAPTVGVLGLQGGVREHADLVESLDAHAVQIRKPADLVGPDGARVDALILPGGESSVIDRLARMFGLDAPIREQVEAGLPTLGTCAGLILLAKRLENPAPGQQTLGILDITVNRNAFGPQVESAEATLGTEWGEIRAAFIRAPQIVSVDGAETRVMAHYGDAIVGVERGKVLGASFHPELTRDTTLHQRLLSFVG